MAMNREVFLPFQHSPDVPRVLTRVRSTLLSASLQGIRRMGWEERYFRALPKELHEELQMLTAGVWLPLALAVSHYTACDNMGLTTAEIETMGKEVSLHTQKTFVGTVASVAMHAGVTPWTVLSHAQRVAGRVFDGADQCIYKLGPKDALVILVGCPLMRIPYFRTAFRGYYAALLGLFATTIYSRESLESRGEDSVSLRFSWV
jgi:hypothetical protein